MKVGGGFCLFAPWPPDIPLRQPAKIKPRIVNTRTLYKRDTQWPVHPGLRVASSGLRLRRAKPEPNVARMQRSEIRGNHPRTIKRPIAHTRTRCERDIQWPIHRGLRVASSGLRVRHAKPEHIVARMQRSEIRENYPRTINRRIAHTRTLCERDTQWPIHPGLRIASSGLRRLRHARPEPIVARMQRSEIRENYPRTIKRPIAHTRTLCERDTQRPIHPGLRIASSGLRWLSVICDFDKIAAPTNFDNT